MTKTVMVDLEDERQIVDIGRQGEGGVLTLQVNLSKFAEDYGDGTAKLVHKRYRDSQPYIATTTLDDNVLSWNISTADTNNGGIGLAEIRWFVGNELKKTAVFHTKTISGLMDTSEETLGSIIYMSDLNEVISDYDTATANTKIAYASSAAEYEVPTYDEFIVVSDESTKSSEDLVSYNCYNIFPCISSYASRNPSYGVRFTWSDDHTSLTINGTNDGTNNSMYNFYFNKTALPTGIEAGKSYRFYFEASGTEGAGVTSVHITYYLDTSKALANDYYGNETVILTIPDNCIGLLIRAQVAVSTDEQTSKSDMVYSNFRILGTLTNAEIQEELNFKQDTLVAGTNIAIASDGKTISASSDVESVNSKTGTVVLTAEDIENGTSTVAEDITSLKTDLISNTYTVDKLRLSGDATWTESNFNGLTISKVSDTQIKIYGTPEAARTLAIFNGDMRVCDPSSEFIRTVKAGTYNLTFTETGYATGHRLWYTYNSLENRVALSEGEVIFESDAMLVIAASTASDFGSKTDPTYIEIHLTQKVEVNPDGKLYSTGDETDRTDDILNALLAVGHCKLGAGTFYVNGLDMPDGTMISGTGKESILKLSGTDTDAYCIKMQRFCTLHDVTFIDNDKKQYSISDAEKRDAIRFQANYDGKDSGATETTENCSVESVWIFNFSGAGIYCHNTSINYAKCLYCSNVFISGCYRGIYIDYYSEFNKFTNCCISWCRIACENDGGNNAFTACTFHARRRADGDAEDSGDCIGFLIDGDPIKTPNNAHGLVTGCTFCHTGANSGTAISVKGVTAGYVFSNCQIWYNGIECIDSDGIVFSGCEFGRGAKTSTAASAGMNITVSGGNLVLISGCIFNSDDEYPPTVNVTDNTKVRMVNCYGGVSGKLYQLVNNELTSN